MCRPIWLSFLVSSGLRNGLCLYHGELQGWVEERDPTFRNIDNYAATDAFLVANVFKDAIKEGMGLDTIEVERSPICRLDSDCWDVKLTFFDPSQSV